jgi:hypothetical protein
VRFSRTYLYPISGSMLEPIGGRSKSSPKEVGVIGAISAQKHVENPALNRGIGSTAKQQTTPFIV